MGNRDKKPDKHWLRSKTLVAGAANVLIVHFFDEVKKFICEYPLIYAVLIFILMIVIRQFTAGGLKWGMKLLKCKKQKN